jgi:hypothetical protein
MALEDLVEGVDKGAKRRRDRLIAVYIGILAVALAICSMGAGNATKDAMTSNIESANTWAFFQAKNIRRHILRLQIDELEVLEAADPELPESARSAISGKIKKYRDKEAHLKSEPETGEGLDELFIKGKSLEAQRNVAMRRDRYFDYGMALLQIAIVLASVSIITGGTSLLVLSVLVSAIGIVSTLNGFTLAYTVPFIG